MNCLQKITEGKTKIIRQDPDNENRVIIEFKDDITAGDGDKHDILENNSVLSCQTSVNCFRLLYTHLINTHYVRERDKSSFYALKMDMIPLEFVVRRVAAGSYLDRHPRIKEGKTFKKLVIECFLKDNKRHDPLIIYKKGDWLFYDAHIEVCNTTIRGVISKVITQNGKTVSWQMISTLRIRSKKIFEVLEKAWKRLNVTLVDLKVEFGFDNTIGKAYLADDITNGSWRIWPGGDKKKMLDKQLFRDGHDMGKIQNAFAHVAQATGTNIFQGIQENSTLPIFTPT